MNHWLLKTEPDEWSWTKQVKKGIEGWSGVRNAQAANNLRAMRNGDLCFFYHTGTERRIVGSNTYNSCQVGSAITRRMLTTIGGWPSRSITRGMPSASTASIASMASWSVMMRTRRGSFEIMVALHPAIARSL